MAWLWLVDETLGHSPTLPFSIKHCRLSSLSSVVNKIFKTLSIGSCAKESARATAHQRPWGLFSSSWVLSLILFYLVSYCLMGFLCFRCFCLSLHPRISHFHHFPSFPFCLLSVFLSFFLSSNLLSKKHYFSFCLWRLG